MAAPRRGITGNGTYFIRASSFQRHEFVLMPDHFHLLISPTVTLERSLQLIKGGFSFRVKKEIGYTGEIWQTSFYDRRVRDIEDYYAFRHYIHENPVKRALVMRAKDYPYSSAHAGFDLDEVPQRLKPALCLAESQR